MTSFCVPIGHRQEGGDYVESWQPMAMSEAALASARDMAKAVTDALAQAGNGPCLGLFGVEFFVRGDEVWFSELSPRPHDTGMVTMATQRQSEFELHTRAILGLPTTTELSRPGASARHQERTAIDAPAYRGDRHPRLPPLTSCASSANRSAARIDASASSQPVPPPPRKRASSPGAPPRPSPSTTPRLPKTPTATLTPLPRRTP